MPLAFKYKAVNGIINSYEGHITVESTAGKGTAFTIYLPVTAKQKKEEAYGPQDLVGGEERILFVDDESSLVSVYERALSSLGFSVTTRTSSIEALELFSSKPFDYDLVITDMTMPNMTGDQLAIELMKIRPEIPVILCTGYSKKISDEIASKIGIKALLYKPVLKTDLAETVRKILDEAV